MIQILNPDAEITVAGCTMRAALIGRRDGDRESIEAIVLLDGNTTPQQWCDAFNAPGAAEDRAWARQTYRRDIEGFWPESERLTLPADAKLNTFRAELDRTAQ